MSVLRFTLRREPETWKVEITPTKVLQRRLSVIFVFRFEVAS